MIREANLEDIGQLIELAKIWYSESGTEFNNIGFGFDFRVLEKSSLEFIGSKDFIFLVADEDGDILGSIGAIIFISPFSGKKTLQEVFWYVHPHYRGHGLKLKNALETKGKGIGCQLVIFSTIIKLNEQKLMKFYIRDGFKYLETNLIKEL